MPGIAVDSLGQRPLLLGSDNRLICLCMCGSCNWDSIGQQPLLLGGNDRLVCLCRCSSCNCGQRRAAATASGGGDRVVCVPAGPEWGPDSGGGGLGHMAQRSGPAVIHCSLPGKRPTTVSSGTHQNPPPKPTNIRCSIPSSNNCVHCSIMGSS